MANVNVQCRSCQSTQVYRYSHNPKGHGLFCHRVFQLTYAYEARKPLMLMLDFSANFMNNRGFFDNNACQYKLWYPSPTTGGVLAYTSVSGRMKPTADDPIYCRNDNQ